MVWKAKNSIVFRDEALSIQKLKFSLVNLFWSKTKLFLDDGPTTLVHFIDWMGVNCGVFFVLLYFLWMFFARG